MQLTLKSVKNTDAENSRPIALKILLEINSFSESSWNRRPSHNYFAQVLDP